MENFDYNQWLNLIFRWLHVIAGIMWIGHLWFFNFVNAQVAKTYDADSKKKVIPELMPRALYWFRWGAAYTFITGSLLMAFVYYMGGTLLNTPAPISVGLGQAISFGVLIVGFGVYDMLWKSMAKQETAGAVVSVVLASAAAAGLGRVFSGRAVFIHMGAILGTIMAANVWMRIWPNQRKIIAAIKEGKAPDAAWPALAGLRSKQNTYMSMPLIFFMISNHYPAVYGMAGSDHDMMHDYGWALTAVFLVLGFGIARFCFGKSATDAPKQF
ncbi:MAG: hypothetical protein EXR72_03775 [Myxococcales bacterium]|nr:hypothetical protein [Myxococcales bacterium]